MRHHAYVLESEVEAGVAQAHALVARELELEAKGNPDVITLRYGLLSVEDARHIITLVGQAPVAGAHKVLVIAAERMYHEAQNALLKVFEEPPLGTYLFLILPTLGGLLPTLRSRVHILPGVARRSSTQEIPEIATQFMKAAKEKRSALIKKLSSGKDEEERRAYREEAIALVNGLERALRAQGLERHEDTLREISTLRPYLYDRSAPVKQILEHLSLVVPKGLPAGRQV